MAELKFSEVTVYFRPFDRTYEVYWKVEDYVGVSITFTVLRGETEVGPFEEVSPPLVDTYYFHDTEAYRYNPSVLYYYKIRAEYSGTFVESDVSYLADPVNPEAKSISRMDYLYLKNIINAPVKFFLKKRYGKRCSSCYDPIKGRVIRESCDVCYGTGFEGGYIGPVDSYWNIGVRIRGRRVDSTTLSVEPGGNQAWTLSSPKLLEGDIAYDVKTGVMYVIDQVVAPLFKGYPIRQHILSMNRLPLDAPEYQLLTRP